MNRLPEIDFARIELLVLDVDGVLTDGRVTLTGAGEEIKTFHVHDGSGMKYWKRVGKKLAIISGRGGQAVLRRAEELDVDLVRLNARNKLPAYEQVLAELGCRDDQTAVIGDDLTDLPMLRRCALPVVPVNGVDEAKRVAAYVTRKPGGSGCVREVVELILQNAGLWETIMSRYLPADRNGPE
jgi:3-deoxy-D-manno-octulosonate 8-phosphate phosphatase (KDO 8-P phosphatase)